MRNYDAGIDVLGSMDVSSFVPWLGMIKGIAGGGATGAPGAPGAPQAAPVTQETVRRAIEDERARAKAAAEAKKTRTLLYVTLGVLGVGAVGTASYLIFRKK